MERSERLMLDWIIRVATHPELYDRNSETDMKNFGLTRNQRDVLLSQDANLIREWVAYELGMYPAGGVTHWSVAKTHGLPPPPPPLRESGEEGSSAE
jgi:hypothetical protein